MDLTDEMRERFASLGPDKVRRMIDNGMMVMHLVVPAEHWLIEKETPDVVAQGERKHRPEHQGNGEGGPSSGAGEGSGAPDSP
jgi:hypothetical protein